VDAKASVARDNVAVSSPETMEQCPVPKAGGQSLGSKARNALPSAKSRSVFAFSWSVPGRTEDPATDSSVGSAKLDVSSEAPGVNKAPSDRVEDPAAAVREEGTNKNLSRAPPAASLQDVELTASGTPEGEDVAASKPKQGNFFDRIFKLEKGNERSKTQIDTQEERQSSDLPDGCITAREAAGLQNTSNSVPQGKANDCNHKDLRQDLAGVNGLSAEQPEKAEEKQDNPQPAAAVDNSVMSFLKTLVSPSKAEAKSDSEDKGSKAEKGHGGQPAPKTPAESQTKGAKKKKAESPKLGHSTFSKLFRHKAAKETRQTTNTKSPEQQQPVTSIKSDKNVSCPQEPQTTKQTIKAPEPAPPQEAVASEAPKEVTKERSSSTPIPLSKLFWKKNTSEEAEIVSNEKADASFEAVTPDKDESKSPEAAEVKPRREESKTPKANLRKFFKLTLNATERPVAPAESEPVGQKSKESSKDKKSTVELSKQKGSKQETREQPDSREQQAADTDSIHNGGDSSKEPSFKKTEKRQSLGGFFKGFGSKRTSDAEVQTDPVSILPAGKSK
ncbi:BCAS1 protein, partial [Upupa epops]|nr:BCAS1 protein [Upupa epops]